MKVRWSWNARRQIRAVLDYIAQTSPQYAQSVVDRIWHRAEKLKLQPESGALVEEYCHDDIRQVFESSYRILYRIRHNDVQVVAIIHSARQLPNDLPAADE